MHLKKYFSQLATDNSQTHLDHYYNQTVAAAVDVRLPAYMYIAIKTIKYDEVLQMTTMVKWDVRDIMSQHNAYVDVMIKELRSFKTKLSVVCTRELNAQLPPDAHDLIWSQILKLCNRTFVEGFSQAKKCTNEGRALMQLDYQQFLNQVQQIVVIKPIPEKEMVEDYVKAFYLNEQSLEQWMKSRKEYTAKQLINLVNCMMADSKRSRQRLVAIVEAEYGLSSNGKSN